MQDYAGSSKDKSINRERQTAIIESGTVTTVSTVTTVANQTLMDTYQGKIGLLGQNLAAWQSCCRSRIS